MDFDLVSSSGSPPLPRPPTPYPDVYWRVEGDVFFQEGRDGGSATLEYTPWRVVKRTPKGAWVESCGDRRFVLDGARKRWAYPDPKDALESFRQRLLWRRHYWRRAGACLDALEAIFKKEEPHHDYH